MADNATDGVRAMNVQGKSFHFTMMISYYWIAGTKYAGDGPPGIFHGLALFHARKPLD